MSQDLYGYYERELIFIRQLAQEFARHYPAAAGRLLLEPNRSVDPHVERLIEAFALLSGRVHQKLDDEFPELTESMLGVLYPHYLAPIPSMAIVQFDLDYDRGQLPQGFLIDRGSRLSAPPVNDVACKFRTAYPVTLWPVELTRANLTPPPFPPEFSPPPGAVAALRLRLECRSGLKFGELDLDRLRFYLNGEAAMIAALYEAVFNHVIRVAIQSPEGGDPIWADPADCLAQVGFERDEGMLSYPNQSFLGYRLLTEFFAFPSKFLFVDLFGLRRLQQSGWNRVVDVILYLDRSAPNLEQGITTQTFRLGCAPVVNLFEQTAEPIPLTQARHEYRIVPEISMPLGMEVYSVNSVVGTDPTSRRITEYHPFYSLHHGAPVAEKTAFWYMSRRPSLRENDRGTEVYLSLVDQGFDPRLPAESTLVARTTCTNRDVAARLRHFGDRLMFSLEAAAPLTRIRCVRLPSAPLRPPPRRGAHWRLVSHLCLNHLSLADSAQGLQGLQEILRLYDFSDPDSGEVSASGNRQIIEGVVSVSNRRVVGWIDSPEASGFCRGVEMAVEFDEKKYLGSSVYLFASVLERFFGLYASINSFTQLVARTRSGEGPLKRWPPRAGEHPIL